MPSRARVGATTVGGAAGGASPTPTTYDDTMSGYGPTRADSVGYTVSNPYAYKATQAAKAYRPRGAETVDTLIKKVTG